MGNYTSSSSSTENQTQQQQPFYFPSNIANKIISQQILPKCKDRTVVLAGCGGGCDVYGTTLLYNRVIRAGAKRVLLINLSFTSGFNLNNNGKCVLGPDLCYKVDPGVDLDPATNGDKLDTYRTSKNGGVYFPEAQLANALQHPVYAFCGGSMTIENIAKCHKAMLQEEGFFSNDDDENNTNDLKASSSSSSSSSSSAVLFLTDGGCDAFLKGNETGLATPVEDMMHLRAITKYLMNSPSLNNNKNDVEAEIQGEAIYDPKSSFICAIGANVDVAHGVVESELVARLIELKNNGGLIVSKTLSSSSSSSSSGDEVDEDAAFFCEIVKKCNPIQTIVQSLAVAAIEGHRGNYTPPHLVPRIGQSRINLSELTSTFFILDLVKVANEVMYLNQLKGSYNASVFQMVLKQFLMKLQANASVKK